MKKIRKSDKPTESELEILNILWDQGACSVRTVHEILEQKKPSGYTTTLKLLQIMLEKGWVRRAASGKLHIYRAALQRTEMQGRFLQKIIDTVYNGSASQLVLQALGQQESTEAEIAAIRAYLNKIEAERAGQ